MTPESLRAHFHELRRALNALSLHLEVATLSADDPEGTRDALAEARRAFDDAAEGLDRLEDEVRT